MEIQESLGSGICKHAMNKLIPAQLPANHICQPGGIIQPGNTGALPESRSIPATNENWRLIENQFMAQMRFEKSGMELPSSFQ